MTTILTMVTTTTATRYFKYFSLAFLFMPHLLSAEIYKHTCTPYVRVLITIDKEGTFKGLEEHNGIIEDWSTNMNINYEDDEVEIDVPTVLFHIYSGFYNILGYQDGVIHATNYNKKENSLSTMSYYIKKHLLYISYQDIYKNEPDDYFPKYPVQSQTIAFRCN